MESHSDYVQIATERSNQVAWSNRLFQLASLPSTLPMNVDVPPGVFDESSLPIRSAASTSCTLRSLLPTEVDVLLSHCRCRSNDWGRISILYVVQTSAPVDISVQLMDYVSNTVFDGTVVFIYETDTTYSEMKNNSTRLNRTLLDLVAVGIHDCTLVSNSIVHLNTARVHKCGIISHTLIDAYSFVLNCSYLAVHSPEDINDSRVGFSGHSQRRKIVVGAESGGGRALHLEPESTMIDVRRQLIQLECHPSHVLHCDDDECEMNIIGAHCIVRDTPTICGVYLHAKSSIEAASVVQRALLFPGSKICNGCTVRNVSLQWNASVSDGSFVTDAFLMEHAVVGPQSVISNAVLGPDVHASCGEIHASVLGPNTNAHHQSLVIASLWPCGRGNVGYGANVGSNHTGRIPDQECCIGEGIFWGLSCVVKFPIDLTSAPYSIIAAGTTLLPQRCTMPFSLIANSSEGSTSIAPGWLLRHSPYTLVRSEQKFAQRRKAERHSYYTGWSILRPDTIHLCWRARRSLKSFVNTNSINSHGVYTNDSIPGLGANHLTEAGRRKGIEAYTDCIQQFALQGYFTFLSDICSRYRKENSRTILDVLLKEFQQVETTSDVSLDSNGFDRENTVLWPMFPWDSSSDSIWKSQRRYLLEEFPLPSSDRLSEWLLDLLDRHLILEQTHCHRVYDCKRRDDVRGTATVPDYAPTHIAADDDPVVVSVRKNLEQREASLQALRQKLVDLME